MQAGYKTAVEGITAIKEEEALASVTHTIAEVDKWENANFKEDELRKPTIETTKALSNFVGGPLH